MYKQGSDFMEESGNTKETWQKLLREKKSGKVNAWVDLHEDGELSE